MTKIYLAGYGHDIPRTPFINKFKGWRFLLTFGLMDNRRFKFIKQCKEAKQK